ncbi:MAG: hypothetical protein WCJ14_05630 [Verrucomicrobiota bacterium]
MMMKKCCKLMTAVMVAGVASNGRAAGQGQAFSEVSAVYFGAKENADVDRMSKVESGRFFSTADYGYVPGEEYQLIGKAFGLVNSAGGILLRGQKLDAPLINGCGDWLSDGGKCLCGVTYDRLEPGRLVNRAVVYWGNNVPAKGSWGACIQDAEGNFKQITVDNQKAIYPQDQTTINFAPASVKTFYVGFKDGKNGVKDHFVSVRKIDLHRFEKRQLDNRPAVWQADAYWAFYDSDKPGMLKGLQIFNYYFKNRSMGFRPERSMLNNLSPFIELDGKRLYAAKADYPVQVKHDGRVETLRYELKYILPDGKETAVRVVAVYGVSLKETVKFEFQASGLPMGARLGFEMSGSPQLLRNDSARSPATLVEPIGAGKTFDTPAGPLGLKVKGTDQLLVVDGTSVRLDLFAEGKDLEVALSLPLGPLAGVQPGMVNYAWYPSLANQGDEGVAPFKMEDLELLETVNLADPNDPHVVYDVSNDPMILNWKKSGDKKLPAALGRLESVNDPENGKVPLAQVLGQNCRVITNNKATSYFRFNLTKTRFEPDTPYFIVVEHAYDKERFGEFHAVALDPTGLKIADNNLWNAPNPIGGCDTGNPPYEGRFKKEPFIFFSNLRDGYSKTTQISLCFSNSPVGMDLTKETRPDGLAVKSVSVYRVKKMPALPDLATLLPKGNRRHVTVGTESNGSPWQLSEFPKLAGYNSVFCNHQMPTQLLFGKGYAISRPGSQAGWHANSLESQRWLFASAAEHGVCTKIFSQSLIPLGLEGSDFNSFETAAGTHEGRIASSAPLSPTKDELAHLAKALNQSIAALAGYSSFSDISVVASAQSFFTKRNLDDFSKQTGVAFKSTPVELENIRTMLDSDQKTVDAWIKWSCQKRYEYLKWMLDLARKHRPDLYLSINQGWEANPLQFAYIGEENVRFDPAKLKEHGIHSYHDFLKFVCHDPSLYAGSDGFCFVLERERSRNHGDRLRWPSPYTQPGFEQIRDGFSGGLAIAMPFYDESPKPLKGWTCQYIRNQRTFRRELVEGLLHANARDFFLDTFTSWPYESRLIDLRTFAVPFQLLPFAKPEEYTGKLSDSAKHAVIRKFGDRYGLINAGDQPTDVVLALPVGTTTAIDLSNGIRQSLPATRNPNGEAEVKIQLEPWSLRTLEIH